MAESSSIAVKKNNESNMTSSLAKILAERCSLEESVLAEAQRVRAEKGGSLGQILLQQEAITEPQLLQALSDQYDIPFWPRLPLDNIESEFVEKVQIHYLKRHFMVPLDLHKPATAMDCGLADGQNAPADTELSPPGWVIAINDPTQLSGNG